MISCPYSTIPDSTHDRYPYGEGGYQEVFEEGYDYNDYDDYDDDYAD